MLDSLRIEPRLALDTESDPYHRYREKVCLIQIATRDRDLLLDTLAHGLPDPLRALLADPSRTIVLHGADYDVRALAKGFGLRFGRIFDTAVAAQILGVPSGLKPVLEAELAVIIDKAEQRSDWAKRPLSDAQIEYARRDVRHLLALADRLTTRLESAGRLAWLEEECAQLRLEEPAEKVFDPGEWRAVKGAKELHELGRKALKAAFVWREEEASRRDVPPFRVLRNDELLRVAQRVEEDRGRLHRLGRARFIPPHVSVESLGLAISAGLEREDPAAEPRPPRERSPLDKAAAARLDRLLEARGRWSSSLALDPGFLIPKRVLAGVAARDPKNPSDLEEIEGMTKWRIQALGAAILEALRL